MMSELLNPLRCEAFELFTLDVHLYGQIIHDSVVAGMTA